MKAYLIDQDLKITDSDKVSSWPMPNEPGEGTCIAFDIGDGQYGVDIPLDELLNITAAALKAHRG